MGQKWPDKIILIRHGESARNLRKEQLKRSAPDIHVWTDEGRDQDTPLTERGILQAQAVGKYLALTEPQLQTLFVSPYKRTRQTVEQILKAFSSRTTSGPTTSGPTTSSRTASGQTGRSKGVPRTIVEERIREIDFGVFDGLTSKGIKATYPGEYERRERTGKYWYRPPGGESRPDVALRIHSFLGTLTRDYQRKTVVVVAHSVVVLCFRRLLERWGEDEYLLVDKEDDVKNCSLTTYLCRENRMVLESYNKVV